MIPVAAGAETEVWHFGQAAAHPSAGSWSRLGEQIGKGSRSVGLPYKAKGFVHEANALRKAKGMTRGEEGWLIGN